MAILGEEIRYRLRCDNKKCKHKWINRGKKLPRICPACKSPNWNKR